LAETLVSDGSISPQAARQADFDAILWFFESELGRLVLRYPDNVHREWPFTVSVSAQQAGIASSDERIIIQGIVDLLIHTKERLILLDFKTDAVSEEEIAERAARYVPQIRYYALAVEKILGRPVEQACLYFLKPSKSFPIDLPS
jgi:ATP-dependent helicase/nuclease subunit A